MSTNDNAVMSGATSRNDDAFKALEKRYSAQPNEDPVVYEFTTDRGYLHQYFLLRQEQHVRREVKEDVYDKVSHILIARKGNHVIGGARLTVREGEEEFALPMETKTFHLRDVLSATDVDLHKNRHAEISSFAIFEEYVDSHGMMAEMVRILNQKAAQLHISYCFSTMPLTMAKHWQLLNLRQGHGCEILEDIAVSSPADLPEAKLYLLLSRKPQKPEGGYPGVYYSVGKKAGSTSAEMPPSTLAEMQNATAKQGNIVKADPKQVALITAAKPEEVKYEMVFTRDKALIAEYKKLREQLYGVDRRFVGFREFSDVEAENYEDPDDQMLIMHDGNRVYGGACLRISTPQHPVILNTEQDVVPPAGKFYYSIKENLPELELDKYSYSEFVRIVVDPSLRKGKAVRELYDAALARCVEYRVRYMFGIADKVRTRLYQQIYGTGKTISIPIPMRPEYEGVDMNLIYVDMKKYYMTPDDQDAKCLLEPLSDFEFY